MKLPFFSKHKEEKDFFLSLIISSGKITSILFEKVNGKLLILGTHSEEFTQPLEALPEARLVELSDSVISRVEEYLPDAAFLDKTIFAVPSTWVMEGKITKDYLAKLKTLCDSLKLTPVGFIVSIEAIVAYLHKKEGAPVTAIFIEASTNHVTCAIVKTGIILGTFESVIEHDVAKTIDSLLLAQSVVQVLPAKIILLNYEHAKANQQSVLGHSWSKSLSFLHIPQVELINADVESLAVISGVSQQMGFDSLPQMNIAAITKQKAPIEVAVSPQEVVSEKVEEQVEVQALMHGESLPSEVAELEVVSEQFGFYRDVDILNAKEEEKVNEIKEPEVSNFAFPEAAHIKNETAINPDIAYEDGKSGKKPFSLPSFPHIDMKMPILFTKIPKGKTQLLYPIIGVIVLLALVFSYYYVFEKAEITIVLDKKEVSKELDVIFSSEKSSSVDDSIMHVEEKEIQIGGSEEKATTGKKETGEKAKGEITLYNKTEDKKTFPKGSIIVGPNNLLFELTDDVNIASTSSFSTTFSSAKGKLQATKFGKEYNIPSGTNFSLENISTSNFFGKNDSAFSGGTKKEIKVVSAADVDNLTTSTIDSLSKKAVEDAENKKGDNEKILPIILDYAFDEKNLSKDEGDEADTVSLTALITFTLGYLNNEEIKSFAKQLGDSEIPSGYVYSEKDSKLELESVEKNEDGDVAGAVKLSSVFLPSISVSEFSKKLVGKSADKVQDIVSGEGIADSRVVITRGIGFLPKILPFNKSNISIKVTSE